MTERKWREYAYLNKENWPEAIPPTGPKREHGPEPWHKPTHFDPHDLDTYPASHPSAASIGYEYAGDVCPYCGVPLENNEEFVDRNGTTGTIWKLAHDDASVPIYHKDCRKEREAERRGLMNRSLVEWSV